METDASSVLVINALIGNFFFVEKLSEYLNWLSFVVGCLLLYCRLTLCVSRINLVMKLDGKNDVRFLFQKFL